MKKSFLGTERLTARDNRGLRIEREISLGDKVVRSLIVQPPSDDRLTALGKQGPATLEMPEEGTTFQTLGLQLWPPHSEAEGDHIIRTIPTLLGVEGVTVEEVHCYDAENMIGWRELHATRPEEAGPWTPETANGLLNAVHVAMTTEVLPPTGDALSLPATS